MNLPIAIFSSILAIGSSAHPLEPAHGKRHVVANLRRSSFARRQGPAVKLQNGTQPVFDAATVHTEVQGLLTKYSMASDFLNGINLNPDTAQPDTDYYGPFNDTPIIQYFANSSKPSSLLKTPALRTRTGPAEGAEPILGLPNEPYASFELMPLKDDVAGGMDVAYYGALKFGTPGQELTVSVDTGSADLWVPVACPGCSHDQFDAGASSTYHNTGRRVSVTYGAGRVAGTVAADTVALGALSVDAQRFVAVRTESQDFMDYASSGLLGLAFRAISRMDAPTFFEGLLAGRKLAAGIFSTHLARGSADGNADGSQICFGCYDLTKTTGPVEWHNLTSKTYWTVGMDGVAVGKNRTAPLNLTAAIDTGSSLILVSDDVAQQFYSMIPGSQDASASYGSGFWTYPCSSSVTNSLVFSGRPYMIHKDDMNLGKLSDDSDDCVGGIIGVSSEYGLPANLAIIGDVFLKSWYVTFDYAGSRLGLAPSVNNR
ncbi:aspartic protease [Phanerochaete sordida]|uniref:Aspartic protease n=1 Tax=Phanerochaete sordida TaxID=48140 RepID=A0A9P3LH10_9APHY|nr:aspartic protease [Phanerochaete sordida]